MDFEFRLMAAMREHGMYTNSINLEIGRYHRFKSSGVCNKKCCEYRIFERQAGAHFKCFRRGIDEIWFANGKGHLSFTEKHLMAMERESVKRKRCEDLSAVAARCARFFQNLPEESILLRSHHYVVLKKIYPWFARMARGMCVLAVRDIDYRIQSLQFIKKNCFKQFKKGASTIEGMIWLCNRIPPDYCGPLRICEGWSTGCTLLEVTRSPVICALNAYNLPKVAVLVKKRLPNANVMICADNDIWKPDNTGLRCGKEAVRMTGYPLFYPDFSRSCIRTKPTDFNDLFVMYGPQAVKKQLLTERK